MLCQTSRKEIARRQRGQLSAAITAEVKRGELMGLFKRVESREPGDFARMTKDELRAFGYGDDTQSKTKKHKVPAVSALP